MPIAYPGNATSKAARAKSGGGYESAIEVNGGAFNFWKSLDFESGTVGQSAQSEFSSGASTAIYANSLSAFSGAQYIESTAIAGSGNTFQFGGFLDLPGGLTQGSEVWARVAIYANDRFWEDSSPFLKFLRIHEEQSGGGNAGYADIYIENDGEASAERGVHFIKESVAGKINAHGANRTPDVNAWTVYEFYIKNHTDPAQGQARLWRNNALIIDASAQTMRFSDSIIDQFLLFTYWNNEGALEGPTVDRTVGIDAIQIATSIDPPTNTDSAGNAFIGGAV